VAEVVTQPLRRGETAANMRTRAIEKNCFI